MDKDQNTVQCKYLATDKDRCVIGPSLMPAYVTFICSQTPCKCPVFKDNYFIWACGNADRRMILT